MLKKYVGKFEFPSRRGAGDTVTVLKPSEVKHETWFSQAVSISALGLLVLFPIMKAVWVCSLSQGDKQWVETVFSSYSLTFVVLRVGLSACYAY